MLPPFALGEVQYVPVANDIVIVNMVAQLGYGAHSWPPIRYDALEKCLVHVAHAAALCGASIHAPRLGCGLAGGKWDVVGPMLERTMGDVSVTVYDP